jgi:hypothetical protein
VKGLDDVIKTCLGSVKDLAAFTAGGERLKRERMGGGSVSSTLFVGDRLTDVAVEGNRAKGTRLLKGGAKEPIVFVRKKGLWYVKRLPKKGASPK